jgi:hypothetical protein
MSTRSARFVTAAALAAAVGVIAVAPAARAQTASVAVDPTSGAPGQKFTIKLDNYKACAPDSPNCIIIDFIQGATTTQIGTAASNGQQHFEGTLTVPAKAVPGPAAVRAHSTLDDNRTSFTVTAAPVSTTSTKATTTTSSPSTSTSTTVAASTTTVSTVILATTIPPLRPGTAKTKKSSSHSDVPRYIAVALVVLAAAATAAVDTRSRRLRP